MKPRERVLAALNHQEPDRVPIDLGSSQVASICRGAYERLRARMGLPAVEIVTKDHVQQLPEIHEDFLQAMGVDTRPISTNPPSGYRLDFLDEGDYWAYYDEWGAKLRMPKTGGHYFDWVEFPIKESTVDALNTYRWPDPDDPARYAGLRERACRLYEEGYALVGAPALGSDLLAMPQRTRGLAESLMDVVDKPQYMEEFLDRLLDIALRAWGHFLDEVDEYLTVATTFEDLGTQNGPLIAPSLYRRLLKPRQKALVDFIKSRSRAKVFLHTCGANCWVIPDLIEIGIDILNPVQVGAKGMGDTAALKREFGRDLVFWGGTCDTQRTLPRGTPADVEAEVRRRIADLSPGGGFVFAAIHNIQNDVPAENTWALFQAAHKYGCFPIDTQLE